MSLLVSSVLKIRSKAAQSASRVVAPCVNTSRASFWSSASGRASFWSSAPLQEEEEEANIVYTPRKEPKETLNTNDLIKTVAEAHDLSQAETRRILNTVLDTIMDVRTVIQFFSMMHSFHSDLTLPFSCTSSLVCCT
jgi:hypothetical protein